MNIVLQEFIGTLKSFNLPSFTAQECIKKVKPVLQEICVDNSWLPEQYYACSGDENVHVIYAEDPNDFMVLIDTWPGDFKGSKHNHNTWGIAGCLYGKERNNLFKLNNNGKLKFIESQDIGPGEI